MAGQPPLKKRVRVPRNAADVLNVAEMRKLARRRLPRAVDDVIDGGAGDETSVRGNREAYRKYWIRPRALVDVSHRDLRTTVLGEEVSLPVMIAPCAFSRMCSADGEAALWQAAAQAGTGYVLPNGATPMLGRINPAAGTGPRWFQLYAPPTREATEAELRRVRAAGFDVLCVTVDTAVFPIRDRDYRNRITIPIKLSPTLVRHGVSRPRWAKDFLLGNIGQRSEPLMVQVREFARTVARVRAITLDEIVWMKEVFGGRIAVKGLMRGDEVREMVDAGVDAIVVSNHGGRNLDGARPTLDILPEVIEAADGRAEVLMDGGIRRGTDVLKALALGARAVLVGRPSLWGLAAFGQPGARRVLEILRVELESAMALAGCATIADIDPSIIIRESPLTQTVPRHLDRSGRSLAEGEPPLLSERLG
jgi:isopentenyl diphosphate isomerase/L-lactate dehydrogenase-like FMN-dependent dehydrogenase